MDDQTERYQSWVQADQEQAELEHRVINRVQAEALALLRDLTHNWQGGADAANDPQEHKTAVIMLVWCGAAEARFDFSLFSDAPAVRAQAVVTGQWNPRSLLGEAQRHFGRFLRGTVSVQADVRWDLRLTAEGERLPACQNGGHDRAEPSSDHQGGPARGGRREGIDGGGPADAAETGEAAFLLERCQE